tara:strand:+ start:7763 stop:8323 length:561 start_codon:yes stop_codon:yes gene_type:complete
MQIRLPATYSDLSLREIQSLMTCKDPIERVSACSSLSIDELRKLPKKAIVIGNEHLDMLVTQEQSTHEKVLDLNGTKYGFIPDWDSFTLGEWIDMDQYVNDFWTNADKIMSILYRPITRSYKDTYEIAGYTAKEDLTDIREMPADIISGAILFFLTTEKILRTGLEASLVGVVKEATSRIDGDGIA